MPPYYPHFAAPSSVIAAQGIRPFHLLATPLNTLGYYLDIINAS